IGISIINAAGVEVLDAVVIQLRFVAEQGQAETALALERAVTRAGVATLTAEQAHDMALKVNLVERAVAGNLDRGGTGRRTGHGSDQAQTEQNCESGHAAGKHSSILLLAG